MADNPSIIAIIQEMLSKGENEQTIYSTLKDLGVEEAQIKNLMLIAQANTFTLLKSEISKITNQNIEDTLPKFEQELQDKIKSYNDKKLLDLKSQLEALIESKENYFESKVDKEVNNLGVIIGSTKEIQEEQGRDIVALDNKLEQRLVGSTKSLLYIRITAFIIGLSLIGLSAFKFFNLGLGSSLDYLIAYVVLLICGTIIMALSLI